MKFFYKIICATIITFSALILTASADEKPQNIKENIISIQETNKTFSVISVTPQGELPASVKYPAIQVQFSEPVVPLKQLGNKTNVSDVISITPQLKGTFCWNGTSILSFESEEEVIPQKEYKIVVNKNLKSIKGSTLEENLSFSFHTEELKIVKIQPGYSEVLQNKTVNYNSVPPKLAEDIAIFFNFPVNAEVVKKFISVTDGKKEIPFEVTKENKSVIRLTLQQTPNENSDVKITLQKGAMADTDCLKTSKSQSKQFHTLVPFEITSCSSSPYIYYSDSEHKNSIALRFTTPLTLGSEDKIAKHFKLSLDSNIKKENIKITNQSLIIYDVPDQSDTTYNLFVSKELSDVYGRKLNKDYSFTINVPKKQSFALFKNQGNIIIESNKKPELSFIHQNIKSLSKYTITPIDKNGINKNLSKTFVLDPTKIEQDKVIEEKIDLHPFLKEHNGNYYGSLMFTATIECENQYTDWRTKEVKTYTNTIENEQIIQVTNLSITTRYSYNKAVVLVSKTNTGEVVSDATVTAYLVPNKTSLTDRLTKEFKTIVSSTTAKDGTADLVFEENQFKNLSNDCTLYIEAKTQNDRILYSPENNSVIPWGNVYRDSSAQVPKMVAFLFTDRGLYKPGEEVSFNVIDRTLLEGEYKMPSKKEENYTITLKSSSWKDKTTYINQNGKLSKNSSASGSFKLPDDLKPGSYILSYSRNINNTNATESREIQVQFFEKLRFEATSSIIDTTYYKGDSISATIQAQYLGGGSLSDSSCNATWTSSSTTFIPKSKELKDFNFGPIQNEYGTKRLSSKETNIDENGKATTVQVAEENFNAKPKIYCMEAKVTDSSNQMISTSSQVTVHPSLFYLGISRDLKKQGFTKKGESISFSYVTITPEEKTVNEIYLPKNKTITMKLVRENWKEVQTVSDYGVVETYYEKELITEEEREIPLKSSSKPEKFFVTPKEGGAYKISLQTKDSKGNDVVTEKSFYVTSSDIRYFGDDKQTIKLTADKDEYEVGDTAQIVLQSELPKGIYLLTVEREKIISSEIIELKEASSIINVPIQKSFVPVVYVSISSYSTRNIFAKEKPKSYFGVTALNVSTKTKRFDISIQTDKQTYLPGEKAKITLHASQNGKPLSNAEISLMAVDRSVLDLINYHVQDPVEYFYSKNLFPNNAKGGDSRSLLIEQELYDEVVDDMYYAESAVMMKSMAAGSVREENSINTESQNSAINVRKNFIATAAFAPSLVTDKKGNATYTFTLPDSLTTYRITAVGIEENNFSISEENLQVAEPISVRQVLPRKLRLEDTGEAGVTISNLSSKSQKVTVSIAVYDGIEKTGLIQNENELQKIPGSAKIVGSQTKKINVSANKTVPLMFNIQAKKQGWVTVEFTIQSSLVNEKIILPLEIEKPYIYEAVTTTGTVRSVDDGTEKIIFPSNAEDGKGSLFIQLDPTRLGVLKEAVSYVFHYPYGCMEQRSAAVLPLVAFGDYIKIFGLNSEVKYPKGVAEQEIRTWAKVQSFDGGFPYWPNGSKSNLYVSMRIAEILALAKQNDIPFGNINTEKLASYIINESNSIISNKLDSAWSVYIASYANYTASLLGKSLNKELLNKITESEYADVDSLTLCALAYLNADDKEKANSIANKLKNSCRFTTRGIEIFEKYKNHYWCFFNGEAERYALFLQLFTSLNPEDNINSHIVYELLKMQKAHNGRWQSTAITSRVLISLNEYIKKNKLEELDFTAEALIEGKKLLDAKFKGVTSCATETEISFDNKLISSLPKDKELELKFLKQGQGTLYYTASMKYAIPPEKQVALDNGICVFTEIIDTETGKTVTENTLKAGKTYCKKIIISSVINNEYVAVRAPVPAGCEILNSAFVTTGTIPTVTDKNEDSPWKRYNYNAGLSYTGTYDSEMQYFWDYFPKGSQTVMFYFRAVRKGTYGTPCTTAECMYEEEIFGRSSGKVWNIE